MLGALCRNVNAIACYCSAGLRSIRMLKRERRCVIGTCAGDASLLTSRPTA
jgi:hypothetical protein